MKTKDKMGSHAEKGKRNGKLSFHLATRVMIPLTILIAVAFIFTSISLRSTTEQMQDEIMKNNAESIANTAAAYFADYRGIMQTMMCDPAFVSLFDEIEATSITADADIKKLPSYHSAMEKLEAIAGTDRETIDLAYIIETDKCYLVYNGDMAEYFPKVLERDYYLKAKEQGDIIMCDPYVSAVGNTLVVPMSAPIYNAGGKMTGVAALDFALTSLNKTLAEYDSGNGEFFLVLSENGSVIHNSYSGDFAPENINDSGISADLLAALEQGEGKVTFTMPDGEKVYCAVTSVGNWGWQVISGMNSALYKGHSRALESRIMFIFIAILILVCSITLFICNASIVKPIHNLAIAAGDMANGNLNVSFEVKENNEIGVLGDSLKAAIDRLKNYSNYINEIAAVLTQVSQGNLVFRLQYDYDGEFAKVKTALEQTSYLLNDSLTAIRAAAEQVDVSSSQVSDGAQALSQGATEQASSTQELSATVMEINQHVHHSGEYAKDARTKSDEAGRMMETCNSRMTALVNAMDEISRTSNEIGKIIKAIEDIAFQTNILALNAAVEAARAGVAGKGFAVVADEVRNLAAKVTESASDTTNLIENAVRAVANGVQLATDAASQLSTAAEHVQVVTHMVTRIAETSVEQSSAIQQVTVGLDHISSVVQNNSATAEQSAAASEALSDQAAVMKGLVDKFKLLDQAYSPKAAFDTACDQGSYSTASSSDSKY